jgi:hypothetical protein
MGTNAAELVSYCGGYCGECAICAVILAKDLEVLKAVNDALGVTKAAEGLGWPVMRNIASKCGKQFDSNLNSATDISKDMFPQNCRAGCVPFCDIPKCCQGKGYKTCAECSEIENCDKINMQLPKVRDNLREIKNIGLEAWAQSRYTKVLSEKKAIVMKLVDQIYS